MARYTARRTLPTDRRLRLGWCTARRIRQLIAIGVATTTVAVCSDSSSRRAKVDFIRGLPFDSVFMEVREFTLEEPAIAPITGIWHLRPLDEGRFLVLDRGRDEVRIHGRDGSLVRLVGRRGEGPGEFRGPVEGLLDERGYLYITDTSPRVTRLRPDLTFDTIFRVPAYAAGQIERIGSNLAIHVAVEGEGSQNMLLASKDGEVLRTFHPAHPLLWSVPYWSSFFGHELAVASDRIFVADEFLYPLYMYDSEANLVRTFGTPPRSWAEASRPEPGAFVGVSGFQRLEEWLRSFTVIRHIGVYRDSVLVVTHARHVPEVSYLYRTEEVGLDLYDLEGNKLYEDLVPPGKVLRAQDYL